jgi:hypothetical protein
MMGKKFKFGHVAGSSCKTGNFTIASPGSLLPGEEREVSTFNKMGEK